MRGLRRPPSQTKNPQDADSKERFSTSGQHLERDKQNNNGGGEKEKREGLEGDSGSGEHWSTCLVDCGKIVHRGGSRHIPRGPSYDIHHITSSTVRRP